MKATQLEVMAMTELWFSGRTFKNCNCSYFWPASNPTQFTPLSDDPIEMVLLVEKFEWNSIRCTSPGSYGENWKFTFIIYQLFWKDKKNWTSSENFASDIYNKN